MSRAEAGAATLRLAAEDMVAAEIGLSDALAMLRRELMLVTLRKTGGNQMRAAVILKIHRNTLARGMTPEIHKITTRAREARAAEMATKRKQPRSVHATQNTEARHQQSV